MKLGGKIKKDSFITSTSVRHMSTYLPTHWSTELYPRVASFLGILSPHSVEACSAGQVKASFFQILKKAVYKIESTVVV